MRNRYENQELVILIVAIIILWMMASCSRDTPTEPVSMAPTTIPTQQFDIHPGCYPAHFTVMYISQLAMDTHIPIEYQIWVNQKPQGGVFTSYVNAGKPLWIGTTSYRGTARIVLRGPDGTTYGSRVSCDDDAPSSP